MKIIMISEARKLYVIEEVLKIKSQAMLSALENFLMENENKVKARKQNRTTSAFNEFSGIWTEEEAAEIESAIGESC